MTSKRSSILATLAALTAVAGLGVAPGRAGSCDPVTLAATVSVEDASGGHVSGIDVVLVTPDGQRLDGVTGPSGRTTLRYVGTACDNPPVATALAPPSCRVSVTMRITGQNPDLPPIQASAPSPGPTAGAARVQP